MRSSQSQRQARGCRFSRASKLNTRRVCLTFMECKSIVYNAAKDGKLHRLRVVLDPRSKEEVEQLVSAKTNGATPLIMACRYGHLNVVEYLIDQCHAPIEETGSVTFDGETIDGAPPLWCAAAAGYLNIVKFLVKVGADVNKTTYTNSTPLRAACFDGHFDIVQFLVENSADVEIANRHGHTCLMIACYKGHQKIVKFLLEQSADINRKSIKGNTALHDCAESGSLAILEILLDHGAVMEKDSYGMTPLLAAAVSGHTKVVEYLITCPRCQRKEKVDALELLGATYVDRKRDMLGALKYWMAAMEERLRDPALPKPVEASQIAAYENSVEARSYKELKELMSDPDDMRMQALLVRERILGPAHPDTSYYIRYRGAVYADMGHFERCILLWTYALDMQQQLLEPLCPMTQNSLLSFVELFSFMLTPGSGRAPHPVPYHDMLAVLQKTVRELELGQKHTVKTSCGEREGSPLSRLLLITLHLMQLMCRQQHSFTAEQVFQFKRTCFRLVRLNPLAAREQTALHLACTKEASTVGRYPACSFPSVEVVRLLIEVGANVHAVDMDLNTPLHIAAMNSPCQSDIMRALLQAGAHIDSRNMEHRTSMMLLKNTTIYDIASPLDFMNLQCLAARVIMEHGIDIEGHLPQKLEHFVKMH